MSEIGMFVASHSSKYDELFRSWKM